jgi:hypothetical protein
MSVLRDFGNQFLVGNSPLVALRNMMETKIPPPSSHHHHHHERQYADLMDFSAVHLHHQSASSRYPVSSSSAAAAVAAADDCLGLRGGAIAAVSGRDDCCTTLYNLLQYSRTRQQPSMTTAPNCARPAVQLNTSPLTPSINAPDFHRLSGGARTTVGMLSDTSTVGDQPSSGAVLGLQGLVGAGLRPADHQLGVSSWPVKSRQPVIDWNVAGKTEAIRSTDILAKKYT